MIENGQRQMRLALGIRLHQQIAPPDPIARHQSRHEMREFPPGFKDQILLPAAGVRNRGLTHRHLFSGLPPLIEMMGDRPTVCLRHKCVESDYLLLDHLGFGGAV